VDIDQVEAFSDQDLTCSFEMDHIEGQLHNLSNEASELKVKEHEILGGRRSRFAKCESIGPPNSEV